MKTAESVPQLARTPLYEAHLASGGRMVPFAGYEMPVRYGSQIEEHRAVRTAAGLFDVSHMGEVLVRGPQAEAFLQRLTPNNVARLAVGQAHYSALLSEDGCFLDDLLIYRLGGTEFLLVVNAGGREQDVAWIDRQVEGFDAEAIDRSDELALLALQGPKAVAILAGLCDADLTGLRYYRFVNSRVSGHAVIVSRTGYTGEDGFELYVENAAAEDLWQCLLDAGAASGLVPAGLAARDTLRLEAGMLLSGQDIGPGVTPVEAGVGWIVKLNKGTECIGAKVLREQRQKGVNQRLIGFELPGRAIARSGYPIQIGDEQGVVTSGSWSPSLEKSIGIARMKSERLIDQEAPGTPVVVQVRRTAVQGVVSSLPFYSKPK